MTELIANLSLEDIGLWLVTLVGAASLVAKAITLITGITPNTKDDEWAGRLTRAVSYAQTIIDRLALNPNSKQARN
jgi:hypothetical protein